METEIAALNDSATRVLDQLERCVLGGRAAAEVLLAAYAANGHALLEGVPGIGKTLLARSFAASLGLDFARIQFTPDLMPSDVTGITIFDLSSRSFRFTRGPVFTQVLMADEINRTPPKTQAALLEAMQERQVTIDGTPHELDPAFFVIATQNPIEFEGTYPLPEAQLDRFFVRVEMGLPDAEAERAILSRAAAGTLGGWSKRADLPGPAITREEAVGLRSASGLVHAAAEVLTYLQQLAAAVRSSPHVELGVSPRGALALLDVARAGAVLEGRDFLIPDDLKRFMRPCWAHRILLTPESELEGVSPGRILDSVADSVTVPH